MLEMQSDIVRQSALSKASTDARDTGVYLHEDTLVGQAHALRNRHQQPTKKRLPWFTIVLALSCLPAIMMDGGISGLFGNDKPATAQSSYNMAGTYSTSRSLSSADNRHLSPEEALAQEIHSMANDTTQTATVTVTVGGKSFTREVSMEDLRAMQAHSSGQ